VALDLARKLARLPSPKPQTGNSSVELRAPELESHGEPESNPLPEDRERGERIARLRKQIAELENRTRNELRARSARTNTPAPLPGTT
jgi:hypothetical protein